MLDFLSVIFMQLLNEHSCIIVAYLCNLLVAGFMRKNSAYVLMLESSPEQTGLSL